MNFKNSQLSFKLNIALAVQTARAVDFVTFEQSFRLVVVIYLIVMLNRDNALQEGKQMQYQDLSI